MSAAFRNKGIASTKKECIAEKEKIKKEHLKQVKQLNRKIRTLLTKNNTKMAKSKV
jgi:hypothetical protein